MQNFFTTPPLDQKKKLPPPPPYHHHPVLTRTEEDIKVQALYFFEAQNSILKQFGNWGNWLSFVGILLNM